VDRGLGEVKALGRAPLERRKESVWIAAREYVSWAWRPSQRWRVSTRKSASAPSPPNSRQPWQSNVSPP